MKHLKYFENKIKKYEIGDFVIGKVDWTETDGYTIDEINNYLSNEAGEIVDMELNGIDDDFITLRYMNLSLPMFEFCEDIICFDTNQILRYATQKEIEIFKMKEHTEKFNI